MGGFRFWPEMLLIVIFAGIVTGCIVRRERLRLYWDDLPAIVFLLGGLYGVILSLSTQHLFFTIFGIHASLAPLFFYFAMRWIRPSREDSRRVLTLFLTTYAVLAILSLFDYLLRPVLGLQLAHAARPQLVPSGIDPISFWRLYFRMQSLLFEENLWGSLCALVSLLCLANFIFTRPSRATRALFFLSTVCLILTLSLGSIGCWLLGIAVLLTLRGRHRPRIVFTLAVLVTLGCWAVTATSKDVRVLMLLSRVERSGLAGGNLGLDRQHQWKVGADIFQHNPSGTGIGTVGYGASLTGRTLTAVADGNYFSIAAEEGVPGLITLALTLLGAVWVIVRHLPTTVGTEKTLGMALVAYLCGLCAHAIGANTFEYFYPFSVFWMLFGLFVARRIEASRVNHNMADA
jgi:hypothetical protein